MWIYVDQFAVSGDSNVVNEFCFVYSCIYSAGKTFQLSLQSQQKVG